LAQRGARFAHYFTVAPWTSPSFATVHTSLFPSRHGITLEWEAGTPLIDKDVPMLVPVFKSHGYYTTAYVNNGFGGFDLIGRGFDEFYVGQQDVALINVTEREPDSTTSGEETTKRAISWLDAHHAQPFFLYIHYFEPHSPYDPPPEDDLFKSDAYPYLFDSGYTVALSPAKRLAMVGDQKAIERLYQLYDGKIHYIDRHVGILLDHLRALGLEDNTLVVLTSDHGELLYSHPDDYRTFDHRSLYDPVMHIPFIVAGPKVPAGRVVDGLASNLDDAPTVLSLTGLPQLPDAEGHSLVPLIQGEVKSINDYVYGEEDLMPPVRSVRSVQYKLIRNLWTGEESLFDLAHDPGELHNVIKSEPDVAKDLEARLDEWSKQNEPPEAVRLRRALIYNAAYPVRIIDDSTIGAQFTLAGTGWHSDTEPRSGNFDGGSFWTESGNGSRTAIWRTDNPLLGTYRVSIYYGHPSVGRLATNASFTVVTDSGSQSIQVDFNKEPGQWHSLGSFHNPRYINLTNAADGVVIADAAKFELVDTDSANPSAHK
jgi:arylsulfatase A-like enzyme